MKAGLPAARDTCRGLSMVYEDNFIKKLLKEKSSRNKKMIRNIQVILGLWVQGVINDWCKGVKASRND